MIKLRAWYKGIRMIVTSIDFVNSELCLLSYEIQEAEDGICVPMESVILERFAGHIDKKGIDIYEGDILKTNENGWIAKLIWHYDGFILTGLDNTGFSSSPDYAECEVIGSIHDSR